MSEPERGEKRGRPLGSLDDLQKFDDEFRPATTKRTNMSESLPSAGDSPSQLEAKYRAMLEVSTNITSTLDLTDLLNQILDGVLKVTGCERALLMLKETDGTFSMHLGRSKDGTEWKQEALWISRTVVERVVATGEPLVESDVMNADDLKGVGSIHERNIRSAFCFPLRYQDDMVGVIYADSSFLVRQVLKSDHSILEAFGSLAAVGIVNARRHGELETTRDSLEEQNLSLHKQLGVQFSDSGMVSENKIMHEVFETVRRIAPHDINVLIHGASGTGKELLARAIHDKSARRDGPFVAVNTTSIPEGLVESALFGHVKGAFTHAVTDKAGYFEVADGGTLFLDEIGDMPLEMQPKILRAVQEGEIERVGETRPRKVNVRIVCATHRDLQRLIEERTFRADLFYRLNEAYISLPLLRERREDIVPLAEFFLQKYQRANGGALARLSDDARRYLMELQWEGNIRELQSAIRYGIAFQDDAHIIHASDLRRFFDKGESQSQEPTTGPLKAQIREFEESVIRRALTENNYNMTSTAKQLGISRQQLYNKVRDFDIKVRRR